MFVYNIITYNVYNWSMQIKKWIVEFKKKNKFLLNFLIKCDFVDIQNPKVLIISIIIRGYHINSIYNLNTILIRRNTPIISG